MRVRCDECHFERLVAFSCKKRGFCPSCGARRMAETAALLSDEVFPDVPLRQWVISFPFPLRYLFAAHPQAMGKVLGIIYRAISTYLIHKAGLQLKDGATGAVTLIQRFGSALNLNPNAARSTYTFCSWMVSTYIAAVEPHVFSVSKPQPRTNWMNCYHAPGSADQSACRSLPQAPGLAGTGCRERLAGTRPRRRHRSHAPDPGQFRFLQDRRWATAGTQSVSDPHHPANR